MRRKNKLTAAKIFFCFFALLISSCDITSKLNNAQDCYRSGDYAKAENIYKSVIKKHPDEIRALKGLGDIALMNKNYSAAIANYKRAIEINPSVCSQEMVLLLTFSDTKVRDEAAKAVASLSNGMDEVINAVIHKLSEGNQYVKVDYLDAIRRIGKPASYIAPKIIPYLSHDFSVIRKTALETLAVLDINKVKESGAFQKIIQLMKDKDAMVAETAIKTLASYKTDASSAVPALILMYNDNNPVLQNAAQQAVADIGRVNKETIPGLTELFANKYPANVKIAAIDSLALMGPAANIAAADIIPLSMDSDTNIRRAAVAALARIGRPSAESVPKLIKLLDHPNDTVKLRAIAELAEIGKAASSALPVLYQLRKDSSKEISSEARKASLKISNAQR